MNNIIAKKIVFSISSIFIFVFSTLNFVNAAQYKCTCTSSAPDQFYDVATQAECVTQCTTYCVSHGGLQNCTLVQNNGGLTADTPKAQLQNPLGSVVTIPQIVSKIIKLIMGLVGIISLVMFIYAGFLWLTAQGKPEAVKKGRDTMLWAVVGLVVIFSSYIILNYIFKVLTF